MDGLKMAYLNGSTFGLLSFIPGHGGSSRLTPLELSKIIAFPAK